MDLAVARVHFDAADPHAVVDAIDVVRDAAPLVLGHPYGTVGEHRDLIRVFAGLGKQVVVAVLAREAHSETVVPDVCVRVLVGINELAKTVSDQAHVSSSVDVADKSESGGSVRPLLQ